jgi:hypothetical protein
MLLLRRFGIPSLLSFLQLLLLLGVSLFQLLRLSLMLLLYLCLSRFIGALSGHPLVLLLLSLLESLSFLVLLRV